MQHRLQSAIAPSTRLILIDLVGSDLEDEQTAAYRSLLVKARKTGLMVAHSFRGDAQTPTLRRRPIEGLTPLPDEAVFIRQKQSTFSSRQFCDWVGATSGALIFAGAANAAIASARCAATLGHKVFVSPMAANTNHPVRPRAGVSFYPLEHSTPNLGARFEQLMLLLESEAANA